MNDGRFDPHGLTDDEMLAGFTDLPEDVFLFEVKRMHVDPEVTFSAEALTQLKGQMFLWLGGRLMAYWKRTGRPPQQVRVLCTITFDDEALAEED